MATVHEEGRSESQERPAGIEINGEMYDFPLIDETITLDDERILYLYADCTIKDFLPAHPEWDEKEILAHEIRRGERFRNPALKRALVHIAVRRAHPERSAEDIEEAIGGLSALAVDVAVVRAVESRPPELSSQKQPEPVTNTNKPLRVIPSGSTTKNGSESQDSSPGATGTTESDTSSQPVLDTPSAS